jgi:hypothetical protein
MAGKSRPFEATSVPISTSSGFVVAGSHGEPWFILVYHDVDVVFHHFFHIFPILNSIWLQKNEEPPHLGTLLEGSDCFMAFFLVQASMDCHNLPRCPHGFSDPI